ncbi:hypothetical protein ACJZ2D_000686 [Fusarium nematophilum]
MNQDLWEIVRPHMDAANTPDILSSILKGVDEICLELRANQVDQTQVAATLLDVIAKFWQENRPKDLDEDRLIERVAEGVSEKLGLPEAAGDPGRPSAFVQRLAEVRKINQQSVAEAAKQAKKIDSADLEVFSCDNNPTATGDRVFARYVGHESALRLAMIEWKHVSANDTAKADIITRIRALVTLLCSTNPTELCRYRCLGIYFDRHYEERMKGNQRLGLVYQLPSGSVDLPKSLFALIKEAKGGKRPPLGDRFQLAYSKRVRRWKGAPGFQRALSQSNPAALSAGSAVLALPSPVSATSTSRALISGENSKRSGEDMVVEGTA